MRDQLSAGASSQTLAHELQTESLKLLVIDLASHPADRKRPMLWTDLKSLRTQQAIRIRGRLCAAYMAPVGMGTIICGSRLAHALIVKQQCAEKTTVALSAAGRSKCKQSANMPHAIPRHLQIEREPNLQQ
jgi:hypothetical protein